MNKPAKKIDDQGTTQAEARKLLKNLCRRGFDDNLTETALALGRPSEEIGEILSGQAEIDDDLLMKIRRLADERNIEI